MKQFRAIGFSLWFLVLLLVLTSPVLLATPGLLQKKPAPIEWRELHRHGDIVTRTVGYWPFTSSEIDLQQGETIFVLNEGNRLLGITFVTAINEHDEQVLPEARLQALVSESPGTGYVTAITQKRSTLSALPQPRVVSLTNRDFKRIRVRILEGEFLRLSAFAPVSWLQHDTRQDAPFSNVVGTHYDNHNINNWYLSETPLAFSFDSEQLYWLESKMPGSERWTFAGSQPWFLEPQEQGVNNELLEVMTYESTSRKVLVTETDTSENEELPSYRTMLPGLFSVAQSGTWITDTLSDSLYRVQSVSEDWLFSGNYQSYGLPAVEQMQQEQRLTQKLAQNQLQEIDVPLLSASERSAINRQLVNKTMSGQGQHLEDVNILIKSSYWEFEDKHEPDLWHKEIPVSMSTNRLTFSRLKEGEGADWARPDDSLSNEVLLHIHWPEKTGELVVLVDDTEYRRLFPFKEVSQYGREANWQLKNDVETKHIATVRFFLPENWQNIKLHSVTGNPLVRVAYKAQRKLQLDSAQWAKLLAMPVQSEMLTRFKTGSAQWQSFENYLQWQSAGFSELKIPPLWPRLITQNQPIEGLFDAEIPVTLSEYQTIQRLLSRPDINRWQYWAELAGTMRQAGWEGHAINLMQALVQLHSDTDIQNAAADWLLETHKEKQNDVAITSLLAYRYLSTPQNSDPFDVHAQQLASWFLQRNQTENALFTLFGTSDSEVRKALIDEAATRLGFLFLSAPENKPSLQNKTDIPGQSIARVSAKERIRLRNVEQDLVQNNYLITPDVPLTFEVSQPTNLTLLVRQWFPKGDRATEKHQQDWLTVHYDNQQQDVPLFYSDYRTETLVHADGRAGIAHRMEVLVPGAGQVNLNTSKQAAIINIQEWLPAHHIQRRTQGCQRDGTQYPKPDIWSKQTHQPDEFYCSQVYYQPAENLAFKVVSDEGWSGMPQGAQILAALKDFEVNPDMAKLVHINQLLNQWPDSSAKARLLRRLNRATHWQPLSNPLRVKKFNVFEAKTNEPLSPAAYRNRLLYIPYRAGWEKLSDKTALNYQLQAASGEEFRLLIESQQHLFAAQEQAATRISIRVNEQPYLNLDLKMGGKTEIPLALKPGNHQVGLLKNGQHLVDSVIAKLQFRQNKGPWQEQPLKVRLRLFQADKQQPYEIFLPETSWLRVDSFNEKGVVRHEYLQAPKGIFRWYPEAENDLGHRIYQLVLGPDSDNEVETEIAFDGEPQTKAQNAAPAKGVYVEPATAIAQEAELTGNSWGLWLGKQQRKSPDEASLQNNRYWEIGVYSQSHQREVSEALRYQLSTRLYDGEFKDSYHASVNWWNTQWQNDIDLNVSLSMAGQQGSTSNDFAWSGRINAGLHWQYAIDRRFYNRFSVLAWANVIKSGQEPEEYANAVYSQYKLDHRHGIRLSESLRYKWHHDLESWLNLQANTNPLGQSKWLDNGVSELGTRLFYRGLALDVVWRYQRFLSDEDRLNASSDSRLGIAIDWFNWDKRRHFRWRLGYERNFLTDENYWSLGFSWNRSGSRGVQDYLPQTLAFSALRQQKATLAAMNSQEY